MAFSKKAKRECNCERVVTGRSLSLYARAAPCQTVYAGRFDLQSPHATRGAAASTTAFGKLPSDLSLYFPRFVRLTNAAGRP
jgi:hypothetical protein